VDSLGREEGATELRDAMIKALHKNSDIQIVTTASEADAVIKGNGKIWVTGSMRFPAQQIVFRISNLLVPPTDSVRPSQNDFFSEHDEHAGWKRRKTERPHENPRRLKIRGR
jgi:hypothetical protein